MYSIDNKDTLDAANVQGRQHFILMLGDMASCYVFPMYRLRYNRCQGYIFYKSNRGVLFRKKL